MTFGQSRRAVWLNHSYPHGSLLAPPSEVSGLILHLVQTFIFFFFWGGGAKCSSDADTVSTSHYASIITHCITLALFQTRGMMALVLCAFAFQCLSRASAGLFGSHLADIWPCCGLLVAHIWQTGVSCPTAIRPCSMWAIQFFYLWCKKKGCD